jgi:hypothetical protein
MKLSWSTFISYLRNESHEDEHADTRYDICMVLDDKLMAEERSGVLVVRSTQHASQLQQILGIQNANVLNNAHHHKITVHAKLSVSNCTQHTRNILVPTALQILTKLSVQ